ncbi:MAG: hypothetical protein JEY96_09110 [Bacteroidales bacterium]|nr:hypothetical protein [Bacteroidales bacterium]
MHKFMVDLENKVKGYIQNKEFGKALDLLNEAVEKYSEDSRWLTIRGDLHYAEQKFSFALNDYNKALKADKDNKLIKSKVEMIKEILKFEALDIFESTNLNNDPWLD